MPHDMNSRLWPDTRERFFSKLALKPQHQNGPHCVSTSLAILTGETPGIFQGVVNTQAPNSWSDELKKWGMQLAYCPTDIRKLRFYMPELLDIDDLFTLSYYTTTDPARILGEPNERGWVCGSHVVVLHRDKIFDPATGTETRAEQHRCNDYHTKRIFRVVPAGYHRSL